MRKIIPKVLLLVTFGLLLNTLVTFNASARFGLCYEGKGSIAGYMNDAGVDFRFVPSSVGQHMNVTYHTGDIVLDGEDVMLIKDTRFELNGSIFMSGDSTLILDNAVIFPDFGQWQESFELHENAKLIMKKGSGIMSSIYDFYLFDNSSLNLTDSDLEKGVTLESSATLEALNSKIRVAELRADYGGSSYLLMKNSSASSISCQGNALIVDSHISSLSVGHNAVETSCYLINSTYEEIDKDHIGKTTLYVGWHLLVTVDDKGKPVEGANVEIWHMHNDSLAEQKVTQSNGKAQFDLIEWKITELGSQYVGDYRVKVSYDTAHMEETITLTSSQQIAIPEFPSIIVLSTCMIATLVIVAYRKNTLKDKLDQKDSWNGSK